jgi:hypothetical protein
MEDDIFKLLMIVLLMANDKTGSRDNVFTELNTIIIIGLIMGQNRNGNTGNLNPNNANPNARGVAPFASNNVPNNPNDTYCPRCSSIDDPRQVNRNRRVDDIQ